MNIGITHRDQELINNGMALYALLPDGSDLVSEEMKFGLGLNSPSTTLTNKKMYQYYGQAD